MSKNKLNRKKIGEKLFIFSFLIIPMLNFFVFWLYVNFNSLFLGFKIENKYGEVIWSLENFSMLWSDITSEDSTFFLALKNTLIFFTSNMLISLPISIILCYFIYKKICGYKAFRFLFYLPAILPASVLVILFKYIIAANGPLGRICMLLGTDWPPLLRDSNTALGTILFYTLFFSFGGNMVLLSGAMNHIDPNILEAGRVDGVNLFTELFRIVIPLIWPTLSTLIIFSVVGLFNSSGPILLFTEGAFRTTTISYWIYSQVLNGSYNYPAAIGLVFTAIGLPLSLGIKKLLDGSIIPEDDI